MQVLEWNRKQEYEVADHPLRHLQARLVLQVDLAGDVPPAAVRRMALREVRRLLAEADEDELLAGSAHGAEAHAAGRGEPSNGSRNGWVQPAGLDLRVVKSAHRMVLEVAKRADGGKAVLASELIGAAGLSAPTIGRLLREGEPGYDYLKPYLRISPQGRTKAIDLTNEGRVLASKVRAEAVPL